MRLLVTRPEPEALRLRAILEELGHEVVVEPLLRVSFENCDEIDLEDVQALVATSRNGLRALKASGHLEQARRLPLFVVGGATASEARALGFHVIVTGAGTVGALIGHIASARDPAAGLLLHLAGDQVAGDLKRELELLGFRLRQPVVYRTEATSALSPAAIEALRLGAIDGVILMSPRTASVYVALVRKHDLASAVQKVTHYCLSRAVARRLEPLGAVPVAVARAPSLEEVLALLNEAAAKSEA
jgi:uroporphyrinogen-III synthase